MLKRKAHRVKASQWHHREGHGWKNGGAGNEKYTLLDFETDSLLPPASSRNPLLARLVACYHVVTIDSQRT